MYQVMIVDDEEPVLDSFAFILENNTTDFELCAKARSGTEAVRLIYEHAPDLVFMDIQIVITSYSIHYTKLYDIFTYWIIAECGDVF